MAVSLRQKGVSAGTTMAFLLGNPALNPAVLVLMVFALSWKWALLRLVVGAILVFGVSSLIARMVRSQTTASELGDLAVDAGVAPANPVTRWLRSLGRLSIGLIPEYLIIVFALGAARAWLFPAITPEIGESVLLMIGLAIAGTLFVIPTAGEIPIVQTLTAYGLGAGPAGALLMTLAPISLPSLVMVSKAFPPRALITVAVSVAALGILSGFVASALGF